MARINYKNIVSGKIANMVYRNLDGKQIVQSHPGKIRQSKATKASSSEFQQCSSWGRQIRERMTGFLVNLNDSYMYRRFAGQLYNSILLNTHLPKGSRTPLNADMKHMEGFEFNCHSPFTDYFKPTLTVELDALQQVHVTVPAFQPKTALRFPETADESELMLLVYATNFADATQDVYHFFTMTVPHNAVLHPEFQWSSPPIPDGYFVMVSAKWLYYSFNMFTVRNSLNSKTCNPSMVLFCGNTNS